MKWKMTRLMLGIAALGLFTVPALAIPPYCWDVCEFRAATYHCSYPPFGTITCGEYCTIYSGSCGPSLVDVEPLEAAQPWEAAAPLVSLSPTLQHEIETPEVQSEPARLGHYPEL